MQTKTKYSDLTDEELVRQYAAAAETHGQDTLSGNFKGTHVQADILVPIDQELRDRNAVALLAPLLESQNDSVRVWAASMLIETIPFEVERTLEDVLSKPPNLIKMMARNILENWRKKKAERE